MKNIGIGIAIAAAAAAAIVLLGWNSFFKSPDSSTGVERVACINPDLPTPEQYHIHPVLKILVDGRAIPIPANIGLSQTCHRILHTHDSTGTIHVEPNFYKEYTLGDFFSVWDESFFREGYEIKMTVDGKPSEEYEDLVLLDGQKIVIEYTLVSAPQSESL